VPPNTLPDEQNAGDWLRRNFLWIGAIILVVVLLIVLIAYLLASGRPRSPSPDAQALAGPKPTNNWYVCAILGVGSVPDVNGERARFRLCHNDGWEVLTYCLQPRWPPPELGATCTRLDENTYWCGDGLQNLREYGVLQTPVPTFAVQATATSLPTSTLPPLPTMTPTAPLLPTATISPPTPTLGPLAGRQSPGGKGFLAWLGLVEYRPVIWQQNPMATPTPFQPIPGTALPAEPPGSGESEDAIPQSFFGIDFSPSADHVEIKIIPPNRQVNGGRPILLSFDPGERCKFGDGRACTYTYRSRRGGWTTFVTAHSGLGGEGNALRHALEGTGLDRASFPLERVQENLKALEGAEVVITQGGVEITGFKLVSTGRVPPKSLKDYMSAFFQDALYVAASLNPSLTGAVNPALDQIVLETCGWQMPGEPLGPGATRTAASIYLGVIQQTP
jgi:hypothetical protein